MSGRKNVILPYKLIDAHALSASFDSKAVNIQYLDNIAFQLSVTTTANTGTFSVQVSLDGQIWDTLSLSPAIPALADASTVITINLNQLPYTWVRIHFEIGTGTNGSVTGYVTGKEI